MRKHKMQDKIKLRLTLLLLSPLWLLIQMAPYRLQLALGRRLGKGLRHFKGKTYRTVLRNLQLCFPELSKKKRSSLLFNVYKSTGMALMETLMSWWLPDHRLKNLLTVHGREHLDNALKNHGVILISPHFIILELAGRLLTHQMEFAVMYRPQKIKILDLVIGHYRRKYYSDIITRDDVRKMVKTLKEKRVVWYAPDGDHGIKNSVFAPFFGIPAATITGTSRIAKMSNAKVIPCCFYRRANNTGYDLYFEPPLENFPSDDLTADAIRTNAILETAIRKTPEQYIWQYKRFKTRPSGEKRLY